MDCGFARKALDITQRDLALQVGCSDSLIFKIESDKRRPSRQIGVLLADLEHNSRLNRS